MPDRRETKLRPDWRRRRRRKARRKEDAEVGGWVEAEIQGLGFEEGLTRVLRLPLFSAPFFPKQPSCAHKSLQPASLRAIHPHSGLRARPTDPPSFCAATMKVAFALLLAACLSVEKAFSLVCWYCNGVENNWGCWQWDFCSSSDNFCATTYIGAGFGGYSSQSISKGCVSVCPQAGVNIGVAAVSVKCCSSSFCNISSASSVKTNPLVLALGIVASSFFFLFGPRL